MYEGEDHLKQRDSGWGVGLLFIDAIVMVSYAKSTESLHVCVCLIAGLMKLYVAVQTYFYISPVVCRAFITWQIYKIAVCFCAFAYLSQSLGNDTLFIGCIVLLPLSWDLARTIFEKY